MTASRPSRRACATTASPPCTTPPSAASGAASSRSPQASARRHGDRQGAIIVQEAVAKICDLFGIDPYSSISEGTLVITCRPHKAAEVVARLADKAIPSSIVGEIVPAEKGLVYVEGGSERPLTHPRVDPFWAAFDLEIARATGKA